jgi:hypothetical protein
VLALLQTVDGERADDPQRLAVVRIVVLVLLQPHLQLFAGQKKKGGTKELVTQDCHTLYYIGISHVIFANQPFDPGLLVSNDAAGPADSQPGNRFVCSHAVVLHHVAGDKRASPPQSSYK